MLINRLLAVALMLAVSVTTMAQAQDVADNAAPRIAITLDAPHTTRVTHWPITLGVPFPQGICTDINAWTVVDAEDAAQPCQFNVVSSWPDGSVRWATLYFHADLAKQYFVTQAKRIAHANPIKVEHEDKGFIVHVAGAKYTFAEGFGFPDISLNNQPLAKSAHNAFYVIDSKDRKGIMRGESITIEREGPQHVVVRVEGDYRTEDDQRNARGIAYFYFSADTPAVRISHKLIFTEQTLDLWFKDIGVDIPLQLDGDAISTFNTDHSDTNTYTQLRMQTKPLAKMVQHDFPHFGSEASKFTLSVADHLIMKGKACGDWVDVSSETRGMMAQLPALAEQFPKALAAHDDRLVIKFWASECGRELDFRTKTVVKEYFGHDWIPEDHKVMDISNTAQGAARTHEFTLTPHDGSFTDAHLAHLGHTKHEIYAVLDPQWVSDSAVMDRFAQKGSTQFTKAEAAIEDFFYRNIEVPERIFPNTGFLAWGRNPYTSQGWELKHGRWYPTIHRHGRVLEYNLKRAIWIMYFRSGGRDYREYATRYTRFLHDFNISNFDTPLKPLGWFIQGTHWHSPCFWGAFEEDYIRKNEHDYWFISSVSCLGYGTSEDVIQYVYHYFNAGDFHCRDAAMNYKEAAKKEMAGSVEKALEVTPSYVILRPFGSAYEIDQDPEWYDYCHRFLKAIAGDGSDVINRDKAQNYLKDGEIWTGFYNYYTSTGDKLALGPVVRAAERYYRTNRMKFISRGSSLFQHFATAYRETGDDAYLAWIRQGLDDYADSSVLLHDRGINRLAVDQRFDRKWGHNGAIVATVSKMIGVPVAMRVLDEKPTPNMQLPLATKPDPTAQTHLLFNKTTDAPERIDVYINNFGDRVIEPALIDLAGNVHPLKIDAQQMLRPGEPRGDTRWQHQFNHLYNLPGTHHFYRFTIDAPAGKYELRLGDEITFRVMYSTMNQFQQVAPRGMVIESHRTYFFPVADGVDKVQLFAHRPVIVSDPIGRPVELTKLDTARYELATNGMVGPWRIEGGNDAMMPDRFGRTSAFVRFENIPTVLANDDVARLFPVDSARFEAKADSPITAEQGRFGKGAFFTRNQIVDTKVANADALQREGTVEFWLNSAFDSSALHLSQGKFAIAALDLLRIDPIKLSYRFDVHDSGRGGQYHQGKLTAQLLTADGKSQVYPVQFFMQKNKWYHIAVTWRADGENTFVAVYVNGSRKTYAHYRGGIEATLKPEDLAAPTRQLRFGHPVVYGYYEFPGLLYDELRISNAMRYTEDFVPPSSPFEKDEQTLLLDHLEQQPEMSSANRLD